MADKSGSAASSAAGRARPDYGIDAPGVQLFMAISGVIAVAGFFLLDGQEPGSWLWTLHSACLWWAIWSLAGAAAMFWGSRIGKLHLRDRLIGGLPWRGDELVLDVGCGHGLMLIAAAKRLTSGRATGLDIWQKVDQAGNSREATLRNVEAEGVSDRVDLVDADARQIPFPDGTFDVIVSSWALHNIPDADGRAQAIREIARVLKPGGRLRIVDIQRSKEYTETLRGLGWSPISLSGPNFLFVTPSRTVSATKPL